MRSPKSGADTLPLQATALRPSLAISAMVSFAGSGSRSLTTTSAPSRASRSATCWPMPRPEPVTIATLPSSCPWSLPPVSYRRSGRRDDGRPDDRRKNVADVAAQDGVRHVVHGGGLGVDDDDA